MQLVNTSGDGDEGLGGSLGDGRLASHAGLALLGDSRQQLLDLGDGTARVEALGTGLRAVHDGVASKSKQMRKVAQDTDLTDSEYIIYTFSQEKKKRQNKRFLITEMMIIFIETCILLLSVLKFFFTSVHMFLQFK